MRTNVISRAGSTPAIGNPERSMAQRGASDLFPQLPLGVRVRDGVDRIAGDRGWETALFHLYNRVREAGGQLVVAARGNPATLALDLPDLRSRLSWGLVLQLHELGDEDKAAALRLQAHQRSKEMPAEVASFLMRRCRRDMAALFALLDELDHASLAAQRRLTVPFVKSVLDAGL